MIPIIKGDIKDTKYVSGGIPFINLDYLIDSILIPSNLDIYYGIRPEQLNQRVRNKLSDYIILLIQNNLPIVPNFFLVVKGPDRSAAIAKQ